MGRDSQCESFWSLSLPMPVNLMHLRSEAAGFVRAKTPDALAP